MAVVFNASYHHSPCAILGAAVDVSPMLQEQLHYMGPTTGTRLVERCVPSVVTTIDLLCVFLQAIKNHILQ